MIYLVFQIRFRKFRSTRHLLPFCQFIAYYCSEHRNTFKNVIGEFYHFELLFLVIGYIRD